MARMQTLAATEEWERDGQDANAGGYGRVRSAMARMQTLAATEE
jgi:hypothetical protein